MRQYASRQAIRNNDAVAREAPEPLDSVIDRVMAIAQRVVGAENVIKNQGPLRLHDFAKQVKKLSEQNEELTTKVENMALKASGTRVQETNNP